MPDTRSSPPRAPLPVIGRPRAARAAGIALAYAAEDAEITGADRFNLILVDAEGEELHRLGSFDEDDVVALWRDIAARAGLVRMIVREDGPWSRSPSRSAG